MHVYKKYPKSHRHIVCVYEFIIDIDITYLNLVALSVLSFYTVDVKPSILSKSSIPIRLQDHISSAVTDLNGLLSIYVKLYSEHAPVMPRMYSPPPASKETASKRSRHSSQLARHAHAVISGGILARGSISDWHPSYKMLLPSSRGEIKITKFKYIMTLYVAQGPQQ